jgi:hypothetical protein
MIEILASGLGDTAITSGATLTAGGAVLWLVKIMAKRRIHAEIDLVGGNGSDRKAAPTVCPAHDSLVKLLDERDLRQREDMHEIRHGLDTIHGRLDEILGARARAG